MLAHPKLLKTVRLALALSEEDLAAAAGISVRALQSVESLSPHCTLGRIQAIQQALENLGVTFTAAEGTSGFRVPNRLLGGLTRSR